ncbi:MAG: sugar ABC transporter permease [Armatimonadetes bacterium]|nr:ABC transporter permease subunit [Armatimonadota bacterium]MBS1702745.1 sugar ABC transporter permease [Armatimonadota bacterium]MBS1727555.1 sugar ABC transporter permease [Armatimonadota bacterium]
MLSSLALSLYKYDLADAKYVGFENYRRLFVQDPLFWKALKNTFLYTFFTVPLGVLGSLLIALLLNQQVKGLRIFRTLFYLPSMVPAVASALLWQWVFNADNGILNQVLGWFGLPNIEWLQNEKFTLWAFVLMSLWGIGGQRMIIFLAGLQGIPESYYEAAKLDGAGTFKQFRHITLPSLSPVMFFNLVLGLVGAFQVFTSAYIMTSGGPNNASLFYSLYIFRNAFEYFKMGKASAMAWVLFVILLTFTLIQMALSKRWVHYEGEQR